MNLRKNKFIFNWILINHLAVGTSPLYEEDLTILKKNKIKNVIALCSIEEVNWNETLLKNFTCQRIVLPDSNKEVLPSYEKLNLAFKKLKEALTENITFIHCYASIERSPLLCIMFIMDKYNLSLEDALDYVKRVHKFTNPTNNQLNHIRNFMVNY